MRSLITAAVAIGLVGFGFSAEAADKAKAKGAAKAAVVGNLICAHCEQGIGDSCNVGIRAKDVVFVIEGPAGDALFDDRKSELLKAVSGTISAKDGNLYVKSKKATDPKNKKAKPGSRLIGKLVETNDGLAIQNGGDKIMVSGKASEKLADHVGQLVLVAGVLSVNDDDAIAIDAKTGREFKRKNKKD